MAKGRSGMSRSLSRSVGGVPASLGRRRRADNPAAVPARANRASRGRTPVRRTLARVRASAGRGLPLESLKRVARDLAENAGLPRYRKRLLAKEGDRVVFVNTDDIEWLEADGNNVRLHTASDVYSIRATLSGTLKELDPGVFVRAHRSAVVNLDRVAEVRTWIGGDAVARTTSGAEVRVSRQYREALLERAR